MRIENLNSEKKGDRARVSATVSWEDCNRSPQEVFFETEEGYAEALCCNPNAFLVAAAVAGMHQGERRIRIDEEICPQLKDGLHTALGWLRHWYNWYKPGPAVIAIEAKTQRFSPYQGIPRRAATFFSGGIDALASVRWNRLKYPTEHPRSFRDGILVYGLEIYHPEAFEYVRESIQVLAGDAGLTLIPVYTNVRYLDDDWTFWENEFEGAVFASIAHALVKRLSTVSIASSYDISCSHPHGSHPLLDTNYSSSDLQIRHELITLTRFERTELVAGWDKALHLMRVCNHIEEYQRHVLNCGKCEKCVRTMLALLALGVLHRSHAFPVNDVDEKLIASMDKLNDISYPFYPELLTKMAEINRHDLVLALERKLASYNRPKRMLRKVLIDPVVGFDEKIFGGNLRKMKRLMWSRGIFEKQ